MIRSLSPQHSFSPSKNSCPFLGEISGKHITSPVWFEPCQPLHFPFLSALTRLPLFPKFIMLPLVIGPVPFLDRLPPPSPTLSQLVLCGMCSYPIYRFCRIFLIRLKSGALRMYCSLLYSQPLPYHDVQHPTVFRWWNPIRQRRSWGGIHQTWSSCLSKALFMNTHSNFILNSPNLKTTWFLSTRERIQWNSVQQQKRTNYFDIQKKKRWISET